MGLCVRYVDTYPITLCGNIPFAELSYVDQFILVIAHSSFAMGQIVIIKCAFYFALYFVHSICYPFLSISEFYFNAEEVSPLQFVLSIAYMTCLLLVIAVLPATIEHHFGNSPDDDLLWNHVDAKRLPKYFANLETAEAMVQTVHEQALQHERRFLLQRAGIPKSVAFNIVQFIDAGFKVTT